MFQRPGELCRSVLLETFCWSSDFPQECTAQRETVCKKKFAKIPHKRIIWPLKVPPCGTFPKTSALAAKNTTNTKLHITARFSHSLSITAFRFFQPDGKVFEKPWTLAEKFYEGVDLRPDVATTTEFLVRTSNEMYKSPCHSRNNSGSKSSPMVIFRPSLLHVTNGSHFSSSSLGSEFVRTTQTRADG